ncbi:MAG: phytanoyl-CoA dioxygenase family protein [Roseiarcus sp.]
MVETVVDVRADHETLVGDGVVGLKGAFSRDFAEAMRQDMMTAFWEAIQRPGGAVGRGPRRWYVEIHPQQFGGFVELCSHPWVMGMCEATFGPDYRIVEIGFDTPFQGAMNQPWHRDFPSPPDTWRDRRITSLAFNLTGVDVTSDMGPFEVAPGTQWDDGRKWKYEMFPPESVWPRFSERAVRKYPQMGDISCRSALTIHRGTTHASPIARPVMVLGVDAPGAGHDKLHDLMATQAYYDALPPVVRDHLVCRVVDKLTPVAQKHDIEGLVMGVA